MTVYLEMALRLQQDIDAAEAHLARLRTALGGLQPLLSMNHPAPNALTLQQPGSSPLVEVVDSASDAKGAPLPDGSGKPAGSRSPKEKRAYKARVAKPRSVTGLPSTGGTLWIELMGKRAHTIPDIVDRAIAKLGLAEDARAVLTNRLSAWLYPAMKAGRIAAGSPKGRLKRYRIAA